MGSLDFEGRRVPVEAGDSIASVLFRAGVRTFTRSIKHHRRRGLLCLTGDCPGCLVNVDGEPGVRACTARARDGMRVRRESGRPSTERDLLAVLDRLHALLPVGFYYKAFIRPRFAWELAERMIRRVTGVGRLPIDRRPVRVPARNLHADVLVIGAGVAGLTAALAAAERGERVVLCDEARIGERLAPGPTRERVEALADLVRAAPSITVLEDHVAVGVYEGPFAALSGDGELVQVHPERVIVATGAVDRHGAFEGNDLPGVWLGRGAVRLAGVHGLRPGRRAVVVAGTSEGLEHLETLRGAGVEVVAAVVPPDLAERMPSGVPTIAGGELVAAEGRRQVRGAVVEAGGGRRRLGCDAIVLSMGLEPRDGLLRMGAGLPVVGAGEVVAPGCRIEEAEEAGRLAAAGELVSAAEPPPPPVPRAGYVCLCEDVSVGDLERAWSEGFRSSEILKRYTTATMGPCQGAMCGCHLAAFAAARTGSPEAGTRTTARPPARPVRLEDLAGAATEVVERRTVLHDRHLELGAHLDWSGAWKRPYHYGDPEAEYRAVRERVSVMDVGTLGKFLVAGREAATLLDRMVPCRILDLEPGRSRYALMLDEGGYVLDDGLVCALGEGRYFVTTTSGGADRWEAWLRDRADRWDLHVHVVNQTAMLGAIIVAGPRARDLLHGLSEDPVDASSFPYMGHREISVAGVPCRALRVGFVGELAFELHHPRSRGIELWDALLAAGDDLGIRPHGLSALEVLRLEKGHLFIGQDTLPDDTPAKLGMGWAVAMDKGEFVGRTALERMAELPPDRRLVGLSFEEDARPLPGTPLLVDGRIVGRLSSCERSPVLGRAIGLGWVRAADGAIPSVLRAGEATGTVTPTPFYDPEGHRVRV